MFRSKLAAATKMTYTCRACGYQTSYQENFKKCPVCGIKWG